MGAAQSTRKITLVNDDKAGVIKLSESLAHRLRGQLEEQQYRQHQRVHELPATATEPDPLPTPILTPPPVDLPPPPPPALETAKIPSLIPEAPPAEAQTQGESPKDESVTPVFSKDAHIDNLEPLDVSPEATPVIFPEPSAEPILETFSETSKPFPVEPLSEKTETLTFIETHPEPSPVDKTPLPSEAIVQFLPDEPEVPPSAEEVPPPKSEDVEAVATTIEVAEVETADLSGDIGSGIGEVGSDVSTNDAILMAETVSEVPTVEIPEPETLLAAAFTSSDEPITASAAPDIPSEPAIPTATEPLQVPEPISIAPEPVVTPEPPVVQEPVVVAEPITKLEPLVVPEPPAVVAEPVVPEPLVVAEPVVVEPVTVEEPVSVVEPVTVAEPVITEPVTVAEPVVAEPVIVAEPVVEVEPVTVAEPVVAEPIIVAEPVVEPIIEAEPVAEALPEPTPVVAGEPEPTLVPAFPEPLAVTPGASTKLDVAAVATDIATAAVTSPAPATVATPTDAEVAGAVPEAATVEAPVEAEPPQPAVAVPDVGTAVKAGAGPTLASPGGTIPPWSIYAEEAHLMVMRLKAEKDQEIKKLSDDWRAKLDQREEEFVKTSALTEENFSASLKEVEAMFVKSTCDPVCQNQQDDVMKCYQDHPHQSLRCAREVSQFAQCVDLSRLQAVMKQN